MALAPGARVAAFSFTTHRPPCRFRAELPRWLDNHREQRSVLAPGHVVGNAIVGAAMIDPLALSGLLTLESAPGAVRPI
jgi:hypothetical protein